MGTTTKPENHAGHGCSQDQLSESTNCSTSTALSAPQSIEFTLPKGMSRRPKLVTLQCLTCGVEFSRGRVEHERALRRHKTHRTYCSRECSKTVQHLRVCACGNPKAPQAAACKACYLAAKIVPLTCVQCGTAFERKSSEHQKNVHRHGATGNTFCSKDCYEIHRTNRPRVVKEVTGTCPTCKGPAPEGRKYCSMECYGSRKAKNTEYTGGWSAVKHAVKKRDEGVCALCGQTKQRIAVHHINHTATDNRMENCIVLCEPCHVRYHTQTVEPVQLILRDYFRGKVTGL